MTIVKLKKVTLIGELVQKLQVLDDLQSMGCLHVIPLNIPEDTFEKSYELEHIKEALEYLQYSPQKLKLITTQTGFEPATIETQAFHLKRQAEDLTQEKDAIEEKIRRLKPWGHFDRPNSKEIGGLSLWFYVVPNHELKNKRILDSWFKVNKDNRFTYLTVISENEPAGVPGQRISLPEESLKYLEARLNEIDFKLEDIQSERVKLTRWLTLFEQNYHQLEDQANLSLIVRQTQDSAPLFGLTAWIPDANVKSIEDYAKKHSLTLAVSSPGKDEIPPTLFSNQPMLKGGEDLINFYMTPSYRLWDPSTTVFFSFAIFFAMIFADAGYAILLGAFLAFFWKRLGKTSNGKRFRIILLALSLFSVVWGILVGSYFGVAPPPDSWLGRLKLFDMNNYKAMMTLSIMVGVTHLSIANLAQAWAQRGSWTAIANLGWASVLAGSVFLIFGFQKALPHLSTIGYGFIGLGLLGVVLFTSVEKPIWKRLLKGLLGLTRVSGMFGDVLSYLRLFALGLASASLAGVFNDLARQTYEEFSGFKIILAVLILLVGHSMNFALSLMSGFIHGLRLNFIEFFNWGVPEEGTPFKAFAKKETTKWNH